MKSLDNSVNRAVGSAIIDSVRVGVWDTVDYVTHNSIRVIIADTIWDTIYFATAWSLVKVPDYFHEKAKDIIH
jgi:hypothetical protein